MPGEFNLPGVAPWGRNASEYEAFFALTDVPGAARVLDCAGGPASFAAEWGSRGRQVLAVDPLYRFPPSKIAAEFEAVAGHMLEGMRAAYGRFRWERYGTPENVIECRRLALAKFSGDFVSPDAKGRYVAARLPELPFPSGSFDLALCSHLLFLYSAELDTDTHVAAMLEMLRVAAQVRVFPLQDMDGNLSAHLEPSVRALSVSFRCELVSVPFEFRVGDLKMLRLSRLDGEIR